ncbi:hypothetical protein HNQ78_001897 [Phycisphaera mikurensis]|nr:hypothetical protein [Phycisphaera mikurensis]
MLPERALAWFGNDRRLKVCYERTGSHFQGMHDLACLTICHRRMIMGSFETAS